MKKDSATVQQRQSMQVNRFAYFLYLVLVIYLFIKGDIEWAVTNLGIAMVFDPFDADVKWQDRPTFQKAWLLCHLALTFAGFLYLIFV